MGFFLEWPVDSGAARFTLLRFDGEIFKDGCSPGAGREQVSDDPAELMAVLQSSPHLNVTEPISITIAGHTGYSADVTGEPDCPGRANPAVYIWPMDEVPYELPFGLTDGQPARIIILDADGQSVVIAMAAANSEEFERLAAASDDLLATLAIEP